MLDFATLRTPLLQVLKLEGENGHMLDLDSKLLFVAHTKPQVEQVLCSAKGSCDVPMADKKLPAALLEEELHGPAGRPRVHTLKRSAGREMSLADLRGLRQHAAGLGRTAHRHGEAFYQHPQPTHRLDIQGGVTTVIVS